MMEDVAKKRQVSPRAISALTLLILLVGAQSAIGQQDEENKIADYPGPAPESGHGMDSEETDFMPGPDSKLGDDDQTLIFPDVWCEEIRSDDETAAVCWEAYRAGLSYYEWGLDHRKDVLWWQHITTRAIFFVVLILVGVGVYFAWVQFRSGLNSETLHEVEVSLKGIKVSSPVLGVIILTLSLVFFYLYLRYVYPVQEIV